MGKGGLKEAWRRKPNGANEKNLEWHLVLETCDMNWIDLQVHGEINMNYA